MLAPDTITLHALSKGRNTTQTDLTTRLEEEGLIASRWAELHDDPPRKMIQITDTGRDALNEGVQDVEYLLSGIRNVMEGK
ncbi:PadR family transcriptional regulator [Corynebacterium rhinophilum]|uniref:PadR family transcriptional regulator n=1 Tax=Corynebacterium rhinophilum TaxID=3050197 RepID=UPI00397CEC38